MKNKKFLYVVLSIALVCLLAGGGTLIYFSTKTGEKSNNIQENIPKEKLSELTLELGDKLPTAKDYNYEDTAELNFEEIDTEEVDGINYLIKVGTYNGVITEEGNKYDVTLIVKDTISPKLEVKELTIKEGEGYSVNAFIESKSDNSKEEVLVKFESDEMASYKEVGEYTIKIVATDDSNNETVKETKLVIEKKEETTETSTNTSNNSSKTNNSKKQNTTSTTKPSTSNNTKSQPATPTPAPQPAQDLYYSSLAPNGTANPKALGMLGADDATYQKIIGSRDSFLHKDVAIFNAQGPTVATWGYPEPWSKTNDWINPDGYTYKVVIYNCKRANSSGGSDNPTYNTYTYKGDSGGDCGRDIGEYYYTDTNGNKAWIWNPNNLHF